MLAPPRSPSRCGRLGAPDGAVGAAGGALGAAGARAAAPPRASQRPRTRRVLARRGVCVGSTLVLPCYRAPISFRNSIASSTSRSGASRASVWLWSWIEHHLCAAHCSGHQQCHLGRDEVVLCTVEQQCWDTDLAQPRSNLLVGVQVWKDLARVDRLGGRGRGRLLVRLQPRGPTAQPDTGRRSARRTSAGWPCPCRARAVWTGHAVRPQCRRTRAARPGARAPGSSPPQRRATRRCR